MIGHFLTGLLTCKMTSSKLSLQPNFGSSLENSKIHNEIDKQVCKQSF